MAVEHMYLEKDSPINLFNNNIACVYWSKSTITKGLRHITIRENTTRESVSLGSVIVHHIGGDVNIADIFTKELKYSSHFIKMRDMIACILP